MRRRHCVLDSSPPAIRWREKKRSTASPLSASVNGGRPCTESRANREMPRRAITCLESPRPPSTATIGRPCRPLWISVRSRVRPSPSGSPGMDCASSTSSTTGRVRRSGPVASRIAIQGVRPASTDSTNDGTDVIRDTRSPATPGTPPPPSVVVDVATSMDESGVRANRIVSVNATGEVSSPGSQSTGIGALASPSAALVRQRRASSWSSAVLPAPGAPNTSRVRPRAAVPPAAASATACSMSAMMSCRPTKAAGGRRSSSRANDRRPAMSGPDALRPSRELVMAKLCVPARAGAMLGPPPSDAALRREGRCQTSAAAWQR